MTPQANFYTVVPTRLVTDQELTPNAKLIYMLISSRLNADGYCTLTDMELAKVANCSERTIRCALLNLVNHHYLAREIVTDARGYITGRKIAITTDFLKSYDENQGFGTETDCRTLGAENNCRTGTENNCRTLGAETDCRTLSLNENTDSNFNKNLEEKTKEKNIYIKKENKKESTDHSEESLQSTKSGTLQPLTVPSTDLLRELKLALNAQYHRRLTTAWSSREMTALRMIAKRPNVTDELNAIISFYNSGYQYGRRDILTLLNNWTVELDRAASRTKPNPIRQYNAF